MHRDRWCTAKENSRADSRWWEILKCIVDVEFFLTEDNLSFHGHCNKINNPNSGLFLRALRLHNRVLALYIWHAMHANCASHNKSDIIHHLIYRAPLLFIALGLLVPLSYCITAKARCYTLQIIVGDASTDGLAVTSDETVKHKRRKISSSTGRSCWAESLVVIIQLFS